MSEREIVLLFKDLFEDYKGLLNLTSTEIRDVELWLEEKIEESKKCITR